MSDLISRQAVLDYPIRLDHYDEENGNRHFVLGIESVMEYVEYLPSADAVEVVRCKDCKNRGEICPMRYIEMVGEDERIYDYSTDNGYCSWGERRKDGEE